MVSSGDSLQKVSGGSVDRGSRRPFLLHVTIVKVVCATWFILFFAFACFAFLCSVQKLWNQYGLPVAAVPARTPVVLCISV